MNYQPIDFVVNEENILAVIREEFESNLNLYGHFYLHLPRHGFVKANEHTQVCCMAYQHNRMLDLCNIRQFLTYVSQYISEAIDPSAKFIVNSMFTQAGYNILIICIIQDIADINTVLK